jgi:hypothetical protein
MPRRIEQNSPKARKTTNKIESLWENLRILENGVFGATRRLWYAGTPLFTPVSVIVWQGLGCSLVFT